VGGSGWVGGSSTEHSRRRKSYFGTPVLADVTLLAEQYGLDLSAAKSTAMQVPYYGAAGWP